MRKMEFFNNEIFVNYGIILLAFIKLKPCSLVILSRAHVGAS